MGVGYPLNRRSDEEEGGKCIESDWADTLI